LHTVFALHNISVTNGVVRVVSAVIIVLNGVVEIIRHARYMVIVEMLVTKDLQIQKPIRYNLVHFQYTDAVNQ
jgi:hypothetical protein